MNANGLGLCEVAENRSEKIRFRRHVAKANFYLLNYKKKPIKLAFADYEAESFNLDGTPPFCKTLVSCSPNVFRLFYLASFLQMLEIKLRVLLLQNSLHFLKTNAYQYCFEVSSNYFQNVVLQEAKLF